VKQLKKTISALIVVTALSASIKVVEAESVAGAGFLGLLHPKFPAKEAAQFLRRFERPATAFLYRTFGVNDAHLKILLDDYRSARWNGGAPLQITAYIDCGPCRRPRRNGSLPHFRADLTISQFNSTLQKNSKARKKLLADYRNEARRVRRLVDLAPDFDWIICPSLEDNLSEQGFRQLSKVVRTEFRGVKYKLMRNPMSGGRADAEVLELHLTDDSRFHLLRPGDMYFADGEKALHSSDFIRSLLESGIGYIAWRPCWQGITNNPNTPPGQRTYSLCEKKQTLDAIREAYLSLGL